ncbi:peptide ABC transporter substrate-binding protein [Clostridioides difficile]|uniref:ABC transporter ATP-binding protein n=1 Tax=unclassified Clostridioides TaxID=2635829 RepID=UPI001431DBCB|nr:dipeptide ABC transporter ATP-binding protein [Clostridioides difficile]MDB3085365.1 peptide ABC transporter substrate-binding protein [Clostridioides difficile]MDI0266646.1 dipeptide ABC transporter ATP-binding protein [Clostridioides difficile]NJJ33842.1 dipeptide ABC transporter ATP-binding protein [Clostridioides difficile]NJK14396.1 dipeptide ABC transporter ATP-binding protein [Clostridioides difficile]
MKKEESLLKVEGLKKYFEVKSGLFNKEVKYVKAVDGVSFDLKKGETLAIVGESGCGKSTAGRTILRLIEKTEGKVEFNGIDIYKLEKEELRRLRPKMQMIFQDPYSSLNPRLNVEQIISEAVIEHNLVPKNEIKDNILNVVENCGLSKYHLNRKPGEFSGGQRQRIGIARALALNPEFIVCDEPVSALDVSIQSQIINLLMDLQDKYKLSYLFISHDLSVVNHIAHRVCVMYLGSIIEIATKEELYLHSQHPYTKALMSAVPIQDPTIKKNRIILKGDIPSPTNPPSGCKFHTRCPYCKEVCKIEVPVLKEISKNHFVACHLV